MKTKDTPKVTPEQLAKYKRERQKLAKTPGSQWVFFRDGDDDLVDPWSGLHIMILKVDRSEKMKPKFIARCTQPHHIPWAKLKTDPTHRDLRPESEREVRYSELW